MDKDELTELVSFEVELEKNNDLKIDSVQINRLIESGHKTVMIKIQGSSKQAALNLGKEEKVFENIKKIQSLPDNVVYDFLDCKGKLSNSDNFSF